MTLIMLTTLLDGRNLLKMLDASMLLKFLTLLDFQRKMLLDSLDADSCCLTFKACLMLLGVLILLTLLNAMGAPDA
jgi:hypothetical protein